MVMTGTFVALTGPQFFDAPLPFAIGALFDTVSVSALVHLLIAFPSGRVEGTWPRPRGRRRVRRRRAPAARAARHAVPGQLPGRQPVADRRQPGPLRAVQRSRRSSCCCSCSSRRCSSLIARRQAAEPAAAPRAGAGAAPRRGDPRAGRRDRVLDQLRLGPHAGAARSPPSPPSPSSPPAFLLGLIRTRFFRTAAVGRVIERLSLDPRGVRGRARDRARATTRSTSCTGSTAATCTATAAPRRRRSST